MCTTIEITTCKEANGMFAELLAKDDFDGALGVAQVLWAVCPSAWVFQDCRSTMLGELSARHPHSPLAEVQRLGAQLLGLKFDRSDELFALAACKAQYFTLTLERFKAARVKICSSLPKFIILIF